MNILGVSCYYHDSAAALLQDGMVTAAAEEERFSRIKHDSGFPERAIDFCLRTGGIQSKDLDYVVFYEKPLVKLERILTTAVENFPRSSGAFRDAMATWLGDKLWLKSRFVEKLRVPREKVLFVDHHAAHAASSFFCSPFKEAAILTVDGVGEWTTAAMGTAQADWDGTGTNAIRLLKEIRFPHSLGLLYSAFTAFLGFEVNEGEYKVMGMAPYGNPEYLDKVYRLIRVCDDGSFELDMDYFSFQYSTNRTFSDKFVRLFGEPRDRKSEFITSLTNPDVSPKSPQVAKNQYYADVAASIQRATEDIILRMANHLHRKTQLKTLCMAGGVALNSVANGRILRETPFESLFIQPAAGDSGGALGAALYAWHVLLRKPRKFVLENAYLGRAYDDIEIRAFLGERSISYQVCADDDALCSTVTNELTSGKVVGWFQGRFEWGPRALGNRSILADPRHAKMKEIVNSKIKFREPFRPFAPVILEQEAEQYFEGLSNPSGCYPARYMLLVLPWNNGHGELAPAVNHMGTGRLQTIRPEWNPRYHRLVEQFGRATGVPVLMNTSFNLRGEPIATSPADALSTFTRSDIDVLVLDRFIIRKE
ncbi:MAG: carbamoyltransferase [Armatimonadetes bacterium]|nr:carbamoyltransferase [Armatimonadota bacterium]